MNGTFIGINNITPDDRDGDGIDNDVELAGYDVPGYGRVSTDPDIWDTDGDGISDGCEIEQANCGSFNKTYNSPTNPNNPDSDGDGIKDGDELLSNVGYPKVTDPTNPDTDSDGLEDGDEINIANAPENKSVKETDPTNPDTDDDKLSDGVEAINANSDPTIFDSDNDGVSDWYRNLWNTGLFYKDHKLGETLGSTPRNGRISLIVDCWT